MCKWNNRAYPSIKPLGSWTRDLVLRIGELRGWVDGTYPICYWLAGFTYPADFLTAVLQTTARRNLIPIDTLVWEFQTIYKDEMDLVEQPKEGIYVKGLYLEGAGWDPVNDSLTVSLELGPNSCVSFMNANLEFSVDSTGSIGRGLVVLCIKLVIVGEFSVHVLEMVWRSE